MAETAPAPALIGRCLCGGVTVTVDPARDDVGVCHCRMCRRWTSGPWMALQVPGARIEGKALRVYAATAFAERGFCSVCGAHIFHRPKDGPELAVSAGLFDAAGLYVAREIFIDRKPPWYSFVAYSVKRTEASMILEWLPRIIWRKIAKFGRG